MSNPADDEDPEIARLIAADEAAKSASVTNRQGLDEAKKVLLGQAAALGLKVDARWSPDTLAERVLEAQEAAKNEQIDDFAKAKKTPVRLLRDAFPVEDEKHLAGEVIDVPIEMAKEWISIGVAERADPMPGDD